MVTLGVLLFTAVSAGTLGIGCLIVFHTNTALKYQERYAEAISMEPPSENPEYYDNTREWRHQIFRGSGVILIVAGLLGLAAMGYGVLTI